MAVGICTNSREPGMKAANFSLILGSSSTGREAKWSRGHLHFQGQQELLGFTNGSDSVVQHFPLG